jgi:hypothetical protein
MFFGKRPTRNLFDIWHQFLKNSAKKINLIIGNKLPLVLDKF